MANADMWQPYQQALDRGDAPLLTWWRINPDRSYHAHNFSGREVTELVDRAGYTLRSHGIGKGDRVVHGFGENHYLDLIFRLAATCVGAVPVTVNWEADNHERILFKIELTEARLLLHDGLFASKNLAAVTGTLPQLATLDVCYWAQQPGPSLHERCPLKAGDEKIIIFTSGTTGLPKGVSHDYRSYRANAATFNDFWNLEETSGFTAVVTSALHHANATAICDWTLRRRHGRLHLLSRYSNVYWRILHEIASETDGLIVAPVVSRHFDFLAGLAEKEQLPLPLTQLRASLQKVSFLIGSAPVGPTTCQRISRFCGRLPVVRFGSTETCLQVMGIPPELPDAARLQAFQAGWAEPDRTGYYIGRAHPGHTEVKIVTSVTAGTPGFMEEVPRGVPGYVITRGENVMSGYVGDPVSTARVLHDGWYLGLLDIGFYLENDSRDFYWMSRESTMLIKGGTNYAYDQINNEITQFLEDQLQVGPGFLEVAVVGLKLNSEHEDDVCLTVSLHEHDRGDLRLRIKDLLLGEAAGKLTKGSRPDQIRFGEIPRNFKGAVIVNALKSRF